MLIRNLRKHLLSVAVAITAFISVGTAGCSSNSANFAQQITQTDRDKRAMEFARGTLINCCIEPSLSRAGR
jgi:hypothetical protein